MCGETKPITAKVYDYVYAAIINEEITANELLSEAKLAAQLQVSRAPVREALIMLCNEQILQVLPRMGYQVIQIAPSKLAKLIESRLLLEKYMVQQAFAQIGNVQLAQLRNLLQCQYMESVTPQLTLERWRHNIDFHMMLAGFSDNEYLLAALQQVLKTCARAAAQLFFGKNRISREDDPDRHTQIVDALAARDIERTMILLEEDIQTLL